MKLIWRLQARIDLLNIHSFLSNRNPAAADRIAAEIYTAAKRLEQFPQLGRQGIWGDVRLMQVPRRPYLLPYRVSGDYVEILAVIDERMERPPEWT
jgi:toxin ParE1/3/4